MVTEERGLFSQILIYKHSLATRQTEEWAALALGSALATRSLGLLFALPGLFPYKIKGPGAGMPRLLSRLNVYDSKRMLYWTEQMGHMQKCKRLPEI